MAQTHFPTSALFEFFFTSDLFIKFDLVDTLSAFQEASGVLEFIYHQFADSTQRASLIEDFYGPQYAVFKVFFLDLQYLISIQIK